jgi:pilus assembly protein Flp/PilA
VGVNANSGVKSATIALRLTRNPGSAAPGLQRDNPAAAFIKMVDYGERNIMKNLIVRFVREDAGQDLIEYALLAGVISLGSIAAMITLAGNISTRYTTVGSSVQSAS